MFIGNGASGDDHRSFIVLARALALLVGLILAGSSARAASPAPVEMQTRDGWVAGWLRDAEDPASIARQVPFSFRYGGQSSADLLPAWPLKCATRKLDRQRTERTLTWTDPKTRLEVRCTAIEYSDWPAAEWVLHFSNLGGADSPILEKILPLDLTVPGSGGQGFVVHRSQGEHNSAESFAPVDTPVTTGPLTLAPVGGRSSDGEMPFFNIDSGSGGMAVAVGWSGQWEARFEPAAGSLHAQAGQQVTHFKLLPGESVRTPRMLAVFWSGADPLRGNNLFRQVLIAHYLPRRGGKLVQPPICGSIGVIAPDGSYEAAHVSAPPGIAKRGFEVLWSDMDPQQWYPLGFPTGTGTWEPDPIKYPNGMAPVGKAAHKAGLGYLLWFEPERVVQGTRIATDHPDFVQKVGNDTYAFRLWDPAARAWLTDYIDKQISAGQLDWLRWDFNFEPLPVWQAADAPDRQGITEIRHIEGLYAMWDELVRRHPRMVIDNCASGGRRIDLETLSRSLPLWHSDMQCFGPRPSAEQLQNAGLYRWVPLHGCGVYGLEPSYSFRSGMTGGNIFLTDMSDILDPARPSIEDACKRSTALLRKVRPYLTGDFYPIFPHAAAEDVWFGYQFDRPGKGDGIVHLYRREKNGEPERTIPLRAIDPEARYRVQYEGTPGERIFTGRELLNTKLQIPAAPGSLIVYYERIGGR